MKKKMKSSEEKNWWPEPYD